MGNVAERNDRTRTKIITQPHDLYRFIATPGVEITNLAFPSDDVVWLSWKVSVEDYVSYVPHTNEVVGACFTAVARIHL